MAANRLDRLSQGSLHLSAEAHRAGVRRSEVSSAPAAQTPRIESALAGESLDRIEGGSIVSPEISARIVERGQVAGSRRAEALSRRASGRKSVSHDDHLVPIHVFTGVATLGEENGKPIVIPVIEPLFVPAPNRKKGLGRERRVGTTETFDGEVAAAGDNQGRVFVFDTKNPSEVVSSGYNPDIVASFGAALKRVRAVEEVSLEVAGADPTVRHGHGDVWVEVVGAREQNS